MITVVDYGMGNLRSVAKGFESVGCRVVVTQDPQAVLSAQKLVLPGVGAFKDAVDHLEQLKLTAPLLAYLKEGKPFLGICLGLQLLFSGSEEGGSQPGFGLFKKSVKRFPENNLKVPHIGWNRIKRISHGGTECPLLKGIPDNTFFYFVHSYYAELVEEEALVATTEYGVSFTSMIWKGSVFATQFHPEKSQKWGLQVLQNFGRL